jgi:hypothetical protein
VRWLRSLLSVDCGVGMWALSVKWVKSLKCVTGFDYDC